MIDAPWPMPLLDPTDRAAIAVLDRLDHELEVVVRLASERRWHRVLWRSTLALHLCGSNGIAGRRITVQDAIAGLEGQPPMIAGPGDRAAITGYRMAMSYLLELAADPHFQYSSDLLRSLHFMLLQHDPAARPGHWRAAAPSPVARASGPAPRRGGYLPPPPRDVPDLVERLMAHLNADRTTPSVVLAAMGHLTITAVEPFSDGNGLVARCFHALIRARGVGIDPTFTSIDDYLGQYAAAYAGILADVRGKAWPVTGNPKPWIHYCITGHCRQISAILRRSREYEKLWDKLKGEVRKAKAPERVVMALTDAAMGFGVRNATYRPAAKVSHHLASRDLRAVAKAGLLTVNGRRRGAHYVASPRLRDLRRDTVEPEVDPDPFRETVGSETPVAGLAGATDAMVLGAAGDPVRVSDPSSHPG